MSSASRQSWQQARRQKNGSVASTRTRHSMRTQHIVVEHEEACSYALRTAYLHYLLQPKAKRKQYVPAPKAAARSSTSVTHLIMEYGTSASSSLKLPHNFASAILDRISGVLRGTERLPGFSDASLKRSFAEAYTAFSDENFKKTINKERKIEPLILMFYSSASKATQKGRAPDDESWRFLPDRHLAMFVRLLGHILRANGHERDRPELVTRLMTLEGKLLSNDQDLVGGPEGAGKTIEVVVPLTYDVKDMPMVQVVTTIFGLSLSEAQATIDANRMTWTEEAALKDLKTYQLRLSSNVPGALTSDDFDLDEAFEEWRKGEAPHLSQMMLDILTARPELTKTSGSLPDKPSAGRPQSMFSDDQVYADLSRAMSNTALGEGLDPSLGLNSLAWSDTSSIRTVDETSYTFTPPDPRAFFKYIQQQAMTFDQLHTGVRNAQGNFEPLSRQSIDLLAELCVRWRVPQSSRLVTVLEIASRKYIDMEITADELGDIFTFLKTPSPEGKKPPHMQQYSVPLNALDPTRWPLHDFAAYQHTQNTLHDALLRELGALMEQCYSQKAPVIGPVMQTLHEHIIDDPTFSMRTEVIAQFTQASQQRLAEVAIDVYREYMEKNIPAKREDWDFSHVVNLGKEVIKLCNKIRKRYSRVGNIMDVDPYAILVQQVFPCFEGDGKAIITAIIEEAKERGAETDLQDGFELYKEMVQIRHIHRDILPDQPFAFNIEELLADFVWRWIQSAADKMDSAVDQAIKQDQFCVRGRVPDQPPQDSERHSVSVIDIFMLFNQTVDQVFKLEWENREHHARFMTALAGAFSSGIGRYCDIIDQKFCKEMDRPTAEETAAQSQTTQEKWMQYARDAWNNKEKMEPFHFYAESFVKLNNVEYAMQELDKLEKTMNSEACAALLDSIDGPKKKIKKPSKYTFTVKVVEAEDLKACDPNGFSDPYVVFGDEYQKRLHKTRIIHRNLNPRWDESFEVTVQGAVNMIATVWDYDTFGDHDYVGRTSLKLDPVHFSDYLPREFWLDLDTQGRMLIRVSMEGERDDIQFHFGKAFRHLKRTERDMVRKITDKLTAQINGTLSRETLRNLLGTGGIGASMTNLWKKRTSTMVAPTTPGQIESVLAPLFAYFDENFAIMKQTLTDATMIAVMTRLWKEVLMTIENLLVPPLSEKLSSQKPLSRREVDVVFHWLDMLFAFFNARDEDSGEQLGVPAEVLKSPKWHELASLNFFYFEETDNLIRESERMVTANIQRHQQAMTQHGGQSPNRASAPPIMGPGPSPLGGGAFGSMGTIKRGKSIMMSRNLGTMRKAKEAKRRDAQADPSDDMILRILRMRPEAESFLKYRHRQKDKEAANMAARLIVANSTSAMGSAQRAPFGGLHYGRTNTPRR